MFSVNFGPAPAKNMISDYLSDQQQFEYITVEKGFSISGRVAAPPATAAQASDSSSHFIISVKMETENKWRIQMENEINDQKYELASLSYLKEDVKALKALIKEKEWWLLHHLVSSMPIIESLPYRDLPLHEVWREMDYYNIFMEKLDFCKEIYISILSSNYYCFARVIISLKTVEVWDSLADEKSPVRQSNKIKEILRNLDLAMANQIKKRLSTFSFASFCIRRAQNVPRQPNSFDCGVFVALFMIHRCRLDKRSFEIEVVSNIKSIKVEIDQENPVQDRKGKTKLEDNSQEEDTNGQNEILTPDDNGHTIFLNKVIDLVRDDTSRKDEEISITIKFSKKRQEINQRLSDLRVRKIKLNKLFESRCIPKLNLKEAIDIQKQQHVTIQKLLHAVEKEEHY
ncbi:hypothetical protein F8388_004702 [Cannabis sativa]|uniref:Ubiquitin-like protease family profile domain-containing protein n=1 Tax=Cannabis sativa TaxID=3483 RepID=A0A7J6HN83_CANSA|nr:hypothetical protein F8388_004702 [Cannabis sativa]